LACGVDNVLPRSFYITFLPLGGPTAKWYTFSHMRKKPFINGEFYHVYNRGVDKRNIFSNSYDVERFFQSMKEFNMIQPIGSLYENSFRANELSGPTAKCDKLVEIICYCLNPNHYHFILRQVADGGISEFMKRLGGGYAWYFNNKYQRSGFLFQGRFKSIHINSEWYLLHLSAYVNLNDRVHQLVGPTAKLVKSSWQEYAVEGRKQNNDFCSKEVVLAYFKNIDEYKSFAEESVRETVKRRREDEELEKTLLE